MENNENHEENLELKQSEEPTFSDHAFDRMMDCAHEHGHIVGYLEGDVAGFKRGHSAGKDIGTANGVLGGILLSFGALAVGVGYAYVKPKVKKLVSDLKQRFKEKRTR